MSHQVALYQVLSEEVKRNTLATSSFRKKLGTTLHLYLPPPAPGVHVVKRMLGMIRIGIVSLRRKLQVRCEFRVVKEGMHTFIDITIVEFASFTTNNYFLVMERGPSRKLIYEVVEVFGICVRETEFLGNLEGQVR